MGVLRAFQHVGAGFPFAAMFSGIDLPPTMPPGHTPAPPSRRYRSDVSIAAVVQALQETASSTNGIKISET